jgi:hypothetical protein
MVRDLKGAMQREGAEIGLFVTLEHATSEMRLVEAFEDRVTLGYLWRA